MAFSPEVELTYIEKGEGIQFIADNIQRFKKGDLILVGSGLPHFWRWDDVFVHKKKKKEHSIAVVMHFKKEFWEPSFLELPENKKIRSLLFRAGRGLLITGKAKAIVVEKMNELIAYRR